MYRPANIKDQPEESLKIRGQLVVKGTGAGEKVDELGEKIGGMNDWMCSVEVVNENES